ncbi:MAG: TIM barrel protein [Chitinivibrionales bacterium]|nr:TIM barrel protein [Chitinivibrionales bacterium]
MRKGGIGRGKGDKMKLGFHTHPRMNTIDEIRWIGRSGFDFVDLFLEADLALPEHIDVEGARTVLEQYDLGVVGHTAWYLPIGSPCVSLRDAAVAEAVRCFGVLQTLGAVYVTIHANWAPAKMFSAKEACEYQIDSLRRLTKAAGSYGLRVMYEPVGSPRDTVENVAAVLEAVPDLSLHIDIGHANLCGRDPASFISELHERLVHIHMHDNDGNADQHLPVGCGTIDWTSTMAALKKYFDGTITLEVFSRDRDYALLARDKVKEMWRGKGDA